MPTIRAKDLTGTITSFGNSDFIAGDENASNETKKINSEAIRAGMAVATPSAKGLMPLEINTHFDTGDSSRIKGSGIKSNALIGAVKDADGNFDVVAHQNVAVKNILVDPYYFNNAVPLVDGSNDGYNPLTNVDLALVDNDFFYSPKLEKVVRITPNSSYAGAYFGQFFIYASRIAADDFWIKSGKINVTIEIECDNAVTINPQLYKRVTPSTYTSIHNPGEIALQANVPKLIHLHADITSFTGIDMLIVYLFYNGTPATIRTFNFYIGRMFTYGGDAIPLKETIVETSHIRDNTLNGGKIADATLPGKKINPATVQSLIVDQNKLKAIETWAEQRANFIRDPFFMSGAVQIYAPGEGVSGFELHSFETLALVDNDKFTYGHQVKIIKQTIDNTFSTGHFFGYRIYKTDFENDPLFIETQKINFVIKFIAGLTSSMNPRLYYNNAGLTTVHNLGTVSFVQDQEQVLHFYADMTGITFDYIEVYFLYNLTASNLHNKDFWYGRMFCYAGSFIELECPEPENNFNKNIVIWGDSLTAQTIYTDNMRSKFKNSVVYNGGVGGQESFHIKIRVLNDTAHKDWIAILWIGRNNDYDDDFVEQIQNDLREIIEYLGHERYLILNPINGDYTSDRKPAIAWEKFVELETNLANIYGPKFINIRKILINQYDYKNTRLVNSFTQPSVGSNVSINISETGWLEAADEIGIGKLGKGFGANPIVDFYTVISVTDGTHIVARLDTSNVVAPAGTVQNETTTIGGTTATNYKRIYWKQDVLDYIDDIIPQTLRVDNIHLQNAAYDLIVNAISNRMKSLINS